MIISFSDHALFLLPFHFLHVEANIVNKQNYPFALIMRYSSSKEFSMHVLDLFLELKIILKIYLYICNCCGVLKNSLIV